LSLGQLTVALGAETEDLSARLAGSYAIREGDKDGEHFWLVSSLIDSVPVAEIYSRSGRVVSVHHSILNKEPTTAQDVFDALYAAMHRVEDLQHSTCVVATGSSYSAGSKSLGKVDVSFRCGWYRFYLLRNTFTSEDGRLITGFVADEEIGESY
jgi:hypothetical protein